MTHNAKLSYASVLKKSKKSKKIKKPERSKKLEKPVEKIKLPFSDDGRLVGNRSYGSYVVNFNKADNPQLIEPSTVSVNEDEDYYCSIM